MGTPFSDGAVLQRDMVVPVWGTVSPAKGKVTVKFAGQELHQHQAGGWRCFRQSVLLQR